MAGKILKNLFAYPTIVGSVVSAPAGSSLPVVNNSDLITRADGTTVTRAIAAQYLSIVPKVAQPVSASRAVAFTAAKGMAAADRGAMPLPPNFSAATHARWRSKLAEVVALAQAGDLDGLRAWNKVTPYSTSPKAIERYRLCAIRALEVQQRATNAA